MGTAVFLWIGGLVAGYLIGRIVTNNKKETEIFSLKERLSITKIEMEKLNAEIRTLKSQILPSEQSAKEAFMANINLFKSNLNTLLNGTYNKDDWDYQIRKINNKELSNYWGKVCQNVDSILRMLAMWGIRSDDCIAFVGIDIYNEMYATSSGVSIENGVHYTVKSPCWVITDTNTGKKQILLKGIVL